MRMRILLCLFCLCLAFTPAVMPAGEVVITSFNDSGALTWTSNVPGIAAYRVEWAPAAGDSWLSSWDSLKNIAPSSGVMSVRVPLCYRVVAVPSDPGNLLITECAATPSSAEFVEICNTGDVPVLLDNVWLADYSTYYGVTRGADSPVSSDFRVRFPDGRTVQPREAVVVSLHSATNFQTAYGFLPDYDFDAADTNAPTMLGEIGSNQGLGNAAEMLVLFYWKSGDAVADLDYVLYGSQSNAVDKTGVTVGSHTYLPDTSPTGQTPAQAPSSTGQSLCRRDFGETTETLTGGNGLRGHNETSETFSSAFVRTNAPGPGSF